MVTRSQSRNALTARERRARTWALNPYGYSRAFTYLPTEQEREWVQRGLSSINATGAVTLDPTAGGGSIPFESVRLGLTTAANDLNPVAALIERATVELPLRHGIALLHEFNRLAAQFIARTEPRFRGVFPVEPLDAKVLSYLWARTVVCPYCSGVVPLSPNWRLAPDGTGLRLKPQLGSGPNDSSRRVEFEIVRRVAHQSPATVGDGDGMCPFTDCKRQIDGDEIKRQAQAGHMGEQLMAVVFKRRVETTHKERKAWQGKMGA